MPENPLYVRNFAIEFLHYRDRDRDRARDRFFYVNISKFGLGHGLEYRVLATHLGSYSRATVPASS